MVDSDIHVLKIYQVKYFEILTDFFIDATGKTYSDFCAPSEFSYAVNKLGEELKTNSAKASIAKQSFNSLLNKLGKLYEQESIKCFKSAKNINCCKVNLGGGSRFLETQLHATRRSLLITDTVLIPDPVMPWLEASREHEKFKSVHVLQAVYFILHLTDLISNEFDIPPFLVFPSFEKSLEVSDKQTIVLSNQLIADFFSYYIDTGIERIEDVFEYVDSRESEFLFKVERENLFIPPGETPGGRLTDCLKIYTDEAKQWRSDKFNKILKSIPTGRIVLNGIVERIQPQYHLFENSNELRSTPLLCIDAQAHYFKLLATMMNHRVDILSHGHKNTQTVLSALMNKRLDFLTNINNNQLVLLRKTDENVRFRHKLREFVNSLPDVEFCNIDHTASEVCAYIESLISEHEKQIDELNGKYKAKHSKSALIAGGGLAVSLMPALTPFLGAAIPLAIASSAKYAADKLDERHERKVMSGSLFGLFALAKKKQ